MDTLEKCKQEILEIMQKYDCRFILTWDNEVLIQDKKYNETVLVDFDA